MERERPGHPHPHPLGEPHPEPEPGHPWNTARVWATVAGISAAIALVLQPVTWLTGGLHPQSQIDLAALQKEQAALIARLDAVSATEASDKALVLAQIESVKQLFSTRLDGMWRASDYAERDAHLGRLDTAMETLRDRTTDAAYQIKDLQAKYQSLTTVPASGRR